MRIFYGYLSLPEGMDPEATRAQNKAATVQPFFPADAILGAKCFHPLIYLAAWRHLPGP